MRILGKTKDYYDAALAYGVDPNIVWVRNPSEIPLKDVSNKPVRLGAKPSKFSDFSFSTSGVEYSVSKESIYFCGSRIDFVKFSLTEKNVAEHKYFYDFENFERHVAKACGKSGMRYLTGDKKVKISWRAGRIKNSPLNMVESWLSQEPSKYKDGIFIELNTPIFQLKSVGWGEFTYHIDVNLKNFTFIKYMDPYQCFQQLSTYCSNVLMMNRATSSKYKGQKLMSDISDLDMRDAKGFDDKSFRKDKET